MAFEDFDPIFAEPKVEWTTHSSCPLRPFLFHAYAPDSSHLLIHVTDFHSHTFEARHSVSLLEDIVSILNLILFLFVRVTLVLLLIQEW